MTDSHGERNSGECDRQNIQWGWRMNPFGDIISTYARKNPKGIALISGTRNEKINWLQLNDDINRLASALYDLGVKKGDKGIIMLQNCPEFFVSFFALEKVGALPCPMNYRFTPREIEFQANHSESNVFITSSEFLPNVEAARPDMPGIADYIVVGGESDHLAYEDLLGRYPAEEPPVDCFPDDESQLAYTGGTTGFPKGVVCTYEQSFVEFEGFIGVLLKYLTETRLPRLRLPVPGGAAIGRLIGSDLTARLLQSARVRRKLSDPEFIRRVANRSIPRFRGHIPMHFEFYVMAPFFHAGGWGAGPLCAWLQMGTSAILMSEKPRFDPVEALGIIARYKPMMVGGVPTMFDKMFAVPDLARYDMSDVALVGAGAAAVSKDLKRKILEVFPNAIYMEVFGQTELSPWAMTRLESSAQMDKLKDTVGSPFSTLKVRIVDPEGIDMPTGEVGELIYQGPSVMKGYYRDEERNTEVLKDGWYYSGDLGCFDADGEIKIVGRKLAMINMGGEKIYPPEVEELLESHPAVEHALLVGVPDDTYVEIPAAIVQLRQGETVTPDELIEFCRDRISGFKRPRFVVFVEEIPLTDADKVRRSTAEEQFAGEVQAGYQAWKAGRTASP